MRTKQEPEGQIHEQQAAKIDSKEKNRCEVKEGNQEKNPDSEGPKTVSYTHLTLPTKA